MRAIGLKRIDRHVGRKSAWAHTCSADASTASTAPVSNVNFGGVCGHQLPQAVGNSFASYPHCQKVHSQVDTKYNSALMGLVTQPQHRSGSRPCPRKNLANLCTVSWSHLCAASRRDVTLIPVPHEHSLSRAVALQRYNSSLDTPRAGFGSRTWTSLGAWPT